ncbi:MAG: hypothetical protein KJZ98_08375 [Burkholderiaceae bacterium]|jgi:hypothetical protein|nr:hypothetical protein [Burkholderiaceae bacterium]MEB2351146.1 hypothetical protein [Burkholderiaceae bacterium]
MPIDRIAPARDRSLRRVTRARLPAGERRVRHDITAAHDGTAPIGMPVPPLDLRFGHACLLQCLLGRDRDERVDDRIPPFDALDARLREFDRRDGLATQQRRGFEQAESGEVHDSSGTPLDTACIAFAARPIDVSHRIASETRRREPFCREPFLAANSSSDKLDRITGTHVVRFA